VSRWSRPVVVASILERSAEETARRLEQAAALPGAWVEIRGDHLAADELAGAVRRAGRPAIATPRGGTVEELRRAAGAALAAGAERVDVDVDGPLGGTQGGLPPERLILSCHLPSCDLVQLAQRYGAMAAATPATLKIVPAATNPGEAVAAVRGLLARAAADGRELICFAAGRPGSVTRLLAPAWGSRATYGSMRPGRETGEGQFPASDLLSTHDVLGIGPATRLMALVGSGVSGSPSPAMHGAAYRSVGLDARYLPIEVDRIEDVLPLCGEQEALGLAALAVTIPLKQGAYARCAHTDDLSRAAGAVNTVRIAPAGWHGYNTDGPAVVDLVRRRIDPAGAAAAVVGAGGLARAAAAALSAAGARVTLFGRGAARTAATAAALGVAGRDLADLPGAAWSVLVQATPMGPDGRMPLPADALRGELVVEALYGQDTPLMQAARARGLAVADGLELLVAQGVLQCERMAGCRASALQMARAASQWLAARG